jgi:hypothetical protein
MDSLSNQQPNSTIVDPEVIKRIQDLKDDMVLQVALKEGVFWNAVKKTRAYWAIEAPVKLPPENLEWIFPKEPLKSSVRDAIYWSQDLNRLASLGVKGQERYEEGVEWFPFLAAVVRYHPPLEYLREFAQYGGISLREPLDPRQRKLASGDYRFVEPLITTQHDPSDLLAAWQWYYETLLDEINELLKPQGLNIHTMRHQIEEEKKLEEQRRKELNEAPLNTYVRITDEARVDELREAVRRAVDRQKQRPKIGRGKRRQLTAVEIAYRHDQLGENVVKQVERYPELTSDTFDKYLADGRKILK